MLSPSDVGEFVLATLASKLGFRANFDTRCRVGFGVRFLALDADRDLSVPRCVLALDCI